MGKRNKYMRQIKFRAWDLHNMITDIYVIDFSEVDEKEYGIKDGIFVHTKSNWYLVSRQFVMQFTGLLDKNGKEIYEGDVVKGDWDVVKGIEVSAVDFRGGSFAIEKTGLPLSWGYAHKECEIIGNIYENKELLQ